MEVTDVKRIYSRTIEKPAGFLFARWSAGAKAFEYTLPESKRIINDPYADLYAGPVGRKLVAAMARINPAIREGIVLRARFMDDYARTCIADGCTRIVLLGAGYDSRFLRMPELRQVRLFELDLPSTQRIKQTLTRKLLGVLPPQVIYVGTDFSKDFITQSLALAGFRRDERTLFIWEGVTLFLNEDIIAETLGRLAELAPRNRLVFDFVPPELIDDETDYQGNRRLLQLCASINEPLTFGAHPQHMIRLLTRLGYSRISVTGMREAHKLYRGSADIEDAYFFATAQSGSEGGPGVGHSSA